MEIKILGTGCPKCKSLEKMTREAVSLAGVEASITKEEDIMKIMEYGVMKTPGLVINDKVVLSGRLPSSKEIVEIIQTNK
ncbi:Thioredoxin domain protein [anaerobic digester metagenome]|nr:thioredoxin family protein [Lentimicrobiaceae bacterium]